MSIRKYIKEIAIENYDELIKIIQGKSDYEDLREKFIFRGLEDDSYELIPSALRKDNRLNDFVDEDFKLTLALDYKTALKHGFIDKGNRYDDIEHFTINKYGELLKTERKDFACSLEEFQCVKEMNALMKFFSYADKVGLKVPTSQNVRQLLEKNFHNPFNHEESIWPDEDYYELMALAQHYGIPTRALDWSYDYRIALYFAVKNILNDNYLTTKKKPKNAILWAFNYKYFNVNRFTMGKMYHTIHYRPEYNSNPNLNAQKGLFTFMIKLVNEPANQPYDKFIEEILDLFGTRILPETEYAFYKFIIPENEKPNILKELYREGYSEEYLTPGYAGVSNTIKNRVRLEKLIKQRTKR